MAQVREGFGEMGVNVRLADGFVAEASGGARCGGVAVEVRAIDNPAE